MSDLDPFFNPYRILGIDSNATAKDIKCARARETHIKKNPERPTWAAEEFTKVAQAYAILTDAKKKREWECAYNSYEAQKESENGGHRTSRRNDDDAYRPTERSPPHPSSSFRHVPQPSHSQSQNQHPKPTANCRPHPFPSHDSTQKPAPKLHHEYASPAHLGRRNDDPASMGSRSHSYDNYAPPSVDAFDMYDRIVLEGIGVCDSHGNVLDPLKIILDHLILRQGVGMDRDRGGGQSAPAGTFMDASSSARDTETDNTMQEWVVRRKTRYVRHEQRADGSKLHEEVVFEDEPVRATFGGEAKQEVDTERVVGGAGRWGPDDRENGNDAAWEKGKGRGGMSTMEEAMGNLSANSPSGLRGQPAMKSPRNEGARGVGTAGLLEMGYENNGT
ncbi:hypothetical protein BT69DRAFT_1326396 [Atractiella rhizophila]|nr:hypothetical protein BT69DRAFT_1326396 [Atractiella rhizophila]